MAHFTSDSDDNAPEYDVTPELSSDGGQTWNNVWTADYTEVNKLIDIDLPLSGSGNDCLRWIYPEVETDDDGFPIGWLNVATENSYGKT